MNGPWAALFDEIARWQDAGRSVEFWWRDDDACQPTDALERLTELAESAGIPLALAVIPRGVHQELLQTPCVQVTLLQHGVDHVNRAGAGLKKSEFPGDEAVPDALARLAQGLQWIQGRRSLPVLVPPWNRVSSAGLLSRLAPAGYRGLSRFGSRKASPDLAGLVQVNTHVDIIDWHGGRGFVGEQQAIASAVAHLQARRLGSADASEPTGWLTHHLVHDAACWAFLQALFERTGNRAGVRWCAAVDLFGPN